MMSVVNGKRITFKRARPNPLFYDWLEELYEEAKQKKSKLEPMLLEALTSMSKYPLPLQSGADCAILKGFDKRLCSFLDRCLDVYTNSCKVSSLESCSKSDTALENNRDNDLIPVINTQFELGNNTYSMHLSKDNNNHIPSTSSTSPVGIRKKKKFKPQFRSGYYAFLMVLGDLKSDESVSKSVLMAAAQLYCEENIRSKWKNITRLIKMGLVNKIEKNNKPEYNLTEEGILVAKEVFINKQDSEVIDDIPKTENVSNNDIDDEIVGNAQTKSLPFTKTLLNNGNSKSEVNDLLYDQNICNKISEINTNKSKSDKLLNDEDNTTEGNKALYDGNDFAGVIVIDDTKANRIKNGLLISNENQSEVNDLLYSEIECTNKVIDENVSEDKSDYIKRTRNKMRPVKNITTLLHDNKCKSPEVILNIDHVNCIEMEPDSFDIILIVDKHETSGLTKKNDPTVTQFNKYPELKHDYRSLKVGDFTWIARHKINTNQELVLPYVVERKRMDDLGNSIKDGRFHEQKFRLRKCGLNNVIYLVENHGKNKHVGLPLQTLMQALANTRVQDGFKVHVTESLAHSVRFLATMTLRLIYEYKDKSLKGHNGEPKEDLLMTFGYFNKSSVKNKPLSVTDTFIKLLLQIKGLSVEKAIAITNIYKTPRILIEKYKSCDQKEGEMLLANLKFGEHQRSVGPSVSIALYQLFTFRNMIT